MAGRTVVVEVAVFPLPADPAYFDVSARSLPLASAEAVAFAVVMSALYSVPGVPLALIALTRFASVSAHVAPISTDFAPAAAAPPVMYIVVGSVVAGSEASSVVSE